VAASTSKPWAFNLETRPSERDSVMTTIAARPTEGYSDEASKGVKKKCFVRIELNLMAVRSFLSCGVR